MTPRAVTCGVARLSQVVKQCCSTDGVEAQYIREEVLPDFFKHFWHARMAMERRNYRQVRLCWWE